MEGTDLGLSDFLAGEGSLGGVGAFIIILGEGDWNGR